jgi:hypothetical protein
MFTLWPFGPFQAEAEATATAKKIEDFENCIGLGG